MGYVKNITAHYRVLLDEILTRRPELARASSGQTEVFFLRPMSTRTSIAATPITL